MSVLKHIPTMSDNELTRLFTNALTSLEEGKQPELANTVRMAVLAEWEKRLQQYKAGQYKAETPEQGVLSRVGYRVGNNGISQKLRQQRLDYVMSDILPAVGSPAYMAEWGEPGSLKRYKKLHRVLQVFISSANTLGNMDKAQKEWEEDLEYLELKWQRLRH